MALVPFGSKRDRDDDGDYAGGRRGRGYYGAEEMPARLRLDGDYVQADKEQRSGQADRSYARLREILNDAHAQADMASLKLIRDVLSGGKFSQGNPNVPVGDMSYTAYQGKCTFNLQQGGANGAAFGYVQTNAFPLGIFPVVQYVAGFQFWGNASSNNTGLAVTTTSPNICFAGDGVTGSIAYTNLFFGIPAASNTSFSGLAANSSQYVVMAQPTFTPPLDSQFLSGWMQTSWMMINGGTVGTGTNVVGGIMQVGIIDNFSGKADPTKGGGGMWFTPSQLVSNCPTGTQKDCFMNKNISNPNQFAMVTNGPDGWYSRPGQFSADFQTNYYTQDSKLVQGIMNGSNSAGCPLSKIVSIAQSTAYPSLVGPSQSYYSCAWLSSMTYMTYQMNTTTQPQAVNITIPTEYVCPWDQPSFIFNIGFALSPQVASVLILQDIAGPVATLKLVHYWIQGGLQAGQGTPITGLIATEEAFPITFIGEQTQSATPVLNSAFNFISLGSAPVAGTFLTTSNSGAVAINEVTTTTSATAPAIAAASIGTGTFPIYSNATRPAGYQYLGTWVQMIASSATLGTTNVSDLIQAQCVRIDQNVNNAYREGYYGPIKVVILNQVPAGTNINVQGGISYMALPTEEIAAFTNKQATREGPHLYADSSVKNFLRALYDDPTQTIFRRMSDENGWADIIRVYESLTSNVALVQMISQAGGAHHLGKLAGIGRAGWLDSLWDGVKSVGRVVAPIASAIGGSIPGPWGVGLKTAGDIGSRAFAGPFTANMPGYAVSGRYGGARCASAAELEGGDDDSDSGSSDDGNYVGEAAPLGRAAGPFYQTRDAKYPDDELMYGSFAGKVIEWEKVAKGEAPAPAQPGSGSLTEMNPKDYINRVRVLAKKTMRQLQRSGGKATVDILKNLELLKFWQRGQQNTDPWGIHKEEADTIIRQLQEDVQGLYGYKAPEGSDANMQSGKFCAAVLAALTRYCVSCLKDELYGVALPDAAAGDAVAPWARIRAYVEKLNVTLREFEGGNHPWDGDEEYARIMTAAGAVGAAACEKVRKQIDGCGMELARKYPSFFNIADLLGNEPALKLSPWGVLFLDSERFV